MTPRIQMRLASARDSRVLASIAQAAYAVYLPRLPSGVRPAPMDADYAASIGRGEVWLAERGHRVEGFVVLVRRPAHLLLDNIAVDPESQGRGVGRELLAFAEQYAAEQRLSSIRLYTHAVMVENQRLYERLGYVETARRTESGFDRVFYEKRGHVW